MYVPLENLFNKTGSMYKLVILASRRALELNDGAPRLVEAETRAKPPLVALQEISEGKVTWKVKKPEKEKD